MHRAVSRWRPFPLPLLSAPFFAAQAVAGQDPAPRPAFAGWTEGQVSFGLSVSNLEMMLLTHLKTV